MVWSVGVNFHWQNWYKASNKHIPYYSSNPSLFGAIIVKLHSVHVMSETPHSENTAFAVLEIATHLF